MPRESMDKGYVLRTAVLGISGITRNMQTLCISLWTNPECAETCRSPGRRSATGSISVPAADRRAPAAGALRFFRMPLVSFTRLSVSYWYLANGNYLSMCSRSAKSRL